MRYGTWNLLFTDNLSEGATTPVELSGAFYCNKEETQIAGYIPDNLNIGLYSAWSLTEITEEQFINLMLDRNPEGTLVDGKATFPLPL